MYTRTLEVAYACLFFSSIASDNFLDHSGEMDVPRLHGDAVEALVPSTSGILPPRQHWTFGRNL